MTVIRNTISMKVTGLTDHGATCLLLCWLFYSLEIRLRTTYLLTLFLSCRFNFKVQ